MNDEFRKMPATADELRAFIRSLADDLEEHPDEWENLTLQDFLRAWSNWMADMRGYYSNLHEDVPKEASWQLIAVMLLAARIYE